MICSFSLWFLADIFEDICPEKRNICLRKNTRIKTDTSLENVSFIVGCDCWFEYKRREPVCFENTCTKCLSVNFHSVKKTHLKIVILLELTKKKNNASDYNGNVHIAKTI